MHFALNERRNRHVGQVQTPYFTWAESNANDKNPLFSLISIRFGLCELRRLNLALKTSCLILPLPQRRSNAHLALNRDRSLEGCLLFMLSSLRPILYLLEVGKTWVVGRRWVERTCSIWIGLDKLIQFCTGPSNIKPLPTTRNSDLAVV